MIIAEAEIPTVIPMISQREVRIAGNTLIDA